MFSKLYRSHLGETNRRSLPWVWPAVGLGGLLALLLYFPPWKAKEERLEQWEQRIREHMGSAAPWTPPDLDETEAEPEPQAPEDAIVNLRLEFDVLGRKHRYTLVGENEAALDRALVEAQAAVTALARAFDPENPEGFVGRLHAGAGGKEPTRPRDEDEATVVRAVRAMLAVADQSESQLDPTLGALYRAWGYYGDKPPSVPSRSQMAQAKEHVGRRYLVERDGGLHITKAGVELEPRTVAHGELLKRADAVVARVAGGPSLHGVLLYAGWDAIVHGGTGKGPFRMKVSDPTNPLYWQLLIHLPEGAFAQVSQDQGRFQDTAYDRLYHSILDPVTGFPGRLTGLVIAMGPDPSTAHALARAVFLAGPKAAPAMHKRFPGYELYVLSPELEAWSTAGVRKHIEVARENKIWPKGEGETGGDIDAEAAP